MADEYGGWTVAKLKIELKKRNAKTTGKKDVLIERLLSYDRNNDFRMTTDEVEESTVSFISWPAENSFISVDHKTESPLIDIVHINDYFLRIYSTAEGMSSFSAVHRKGFGMMKQNFLSALIQSQYNEKFYYKGQVHSEFTKNLTYFIKIVISKEGDVVEGHCECVAGKGPKAVCKHIATALYAILNFIEHGNWCIRSTCTSNKQLWHIPKKRKLDVSPKKSENISFSVPEYNISKKQFSNLCFDPRLSLFKNMPSFNDNLQNGIKNYNSGNMRALALSAGFTAASVSTMVHDHDYLSRTPEYQLIYNRIQVTQENIIKIEIKTRQQNRSKHWFKERSLRVTASNVGTIVHMTERRNKEQLVESMINPKNFRTVQTSWGITNEKNAIAAYKEVTTNEVVPCGLIISKNHPYLAGSPDGLVCDLSIIEVKCPYSIRDEKISVNNLDYLEIIDNEYALKKSSNYYYQIQTLMYVTNRRFCDFVIWTRQDYLCISVDRNEELINQVIIPKVQYFFEKYMVPALFKKFFN